MDKSKNKGLFNSFIEATKKPENQPGKDYEYLLRKTETAKPKTAKPKADKVKHDIIEKPSAKEIKAKLEAFSGKPQTEISGIMCDFILETSAKIAYTAIRTAYQNEAHEYFLKLLYQALYSFEKQNNAEYKKIVSSSEDFKHDELKTKRKEKKHFPANVKTKDEYKSKSDLDASDISLLSYDYEELYRKTLELIGECDEKASYVAHKFNSAYDLKSDLEAQEREAIREWNNVAYESMGFGSSEKSLYMPIKPKDYLKVTDLGRAYDTETKNHKRMTDNDFEDYVSVAYTALWECYYANLFHNSEDVWYVSRYVYSKLRTYARDNRKKYDENRTYVAFTELSDKDGNYLEKHFTDKQAERKFNKIDKQAVLEAIKAYMIENLDARSNKLNIVSAFEMNFYGLKQAEISEKLGVNQQMISKYLRYAKDCLSTEAGYTLLHELVETI